MKVKKYNVNEEGLNHFFGPLEARIMELLWSSEGLTVKEVQSIVNEEHPITFNAVMTVMNRLIEKGHLKKQSSGRGRGRVSCYSTIQTKEQFIAEQTKAVTEGLIQEYGDLVVNHMVDALENADPELIARLQEKISAIQSRKPR
ncbi:MULTISPECIES: BlaI/MecI/CopY family transcriptional regulator [unclassified Paenibacillus]|uniref:BlaI/MecI/CopY family transcriptional regulator n=1 Tax=unclassified Paenibacillus TaxID=185978 RepID=UPI001AE20186|nr:MULTISPECIES: BlaI/MecI/CopY family transcriptional regulator [unclassified Paenibacillus]MBP1156963.1 putative transcriptional regulator [Paenibacillus sp. PvP091]MBP1172298.1 putative transcriptional regulator [Paenibacillus sp. PvR098]MBP2438679.1 putative transcriptional regulator [Paenibacillus sp. PvP052]